MTYSNITLHDFSNIVYNFLKINGSIPKDHNSNCVFLNDYDLLHNYDKFSIFRSIIVSLNIDNIMNYTKEQIYDLYDNQFITHCNNKNIKGL